MGAVGAVLQRAGDAALHQRRDRPAPLGLPRRRRARRAGVRLADRPLGRKRLFFVTLAIYLVGALLTAFSWNFASFARLPLHHRRRHRRRVLGDQLGHRRADPGARARPGRPRDQRHVLARRRARRRCAHVVLLEPAYLRRSTSAGASASASAPCSASVILLVRRFVPESPRWLVTHGYGAEAETDGRRASRRRGRRAQARLPEADPADAIDDRMPRRTLRLRRASRAHARTYRARAVLGFSLMVAQAFLYNAIFFTYALVLTRFYGVPASGTGLYLLPFALGNFLGPLAARRRCSTPSAAGR